MSSHMPVINDTVIGKLNPITKIAAVFALGLSALAWPDFTLGLILVVLLLVVSFLAHIQRDFAKIMFGFGIPVTVMLMFIQGLYSPKNRTALLDFGFAQLGLEGVLYAAKVVVSLLVFLGSFLCRCYGIRAHFGGAQRQGRIPGARQPECRAADATTYGGDSGGAIRSRTRCIGWGHRPHQGVYPVAWSGCHVIADRRPGAGYDPGDSRLRHYWSEADQP